LTLIIGSPRSEAGRYLVGDTMISDPRDGNALELSQLKLAFPSAPIAVGFSGSPEIAESAVAEFAKAAD